MPIEECVPPATFRCNRKRMVMIVRVTMHHVNPSQVSLTTTAKAIDLTTTGRRRFVLRRDFPRGIECDDTQTSAKMEGNTLVVELPITNLPSVLPHASGAPKRKEPPVAEKAGRKRKLASEAEAPSAARPEARGKRKVPGADEGSVLGLAEEATAAEAQRHEQGLSKMRKVKDADAEQTAKLALRKQQKDAKKQQLLEALRKHKKDTKKPKAAAGAKAAAPKDSSKKVSFA